LVAAETGDPAADQPNVVSERKTQQDGATTAVEPEVVSHGWRTGGRRCTEGNPGDPEGHLDGRKRPPSTRGPKASINSRGCSSVSNVASERHTQRDSTTTVAEREVVASVGEGHF
jgi:hypothetical protein